MRRFLRAAIAASVCLVSCAAAAVAQDEPPARVGRVSFVSGTVSFHDADDQDWSRATLNYPVTSGGALWTDTGGRAELVAAGTRVRLQGATELVMEVLDDRQFRARLPQGRIDVRAAGVPDGQPYEVLTPRGAVRLLQDGDYVVEAGSTTEPSRIGVIRGQAEFVDLNGSVLAVRAGEIGVASGTSPVAFTVEHRAPPAMPPEWAARDRQIAYQPQPQYIANTVTGYEDLGAYGTWGSNATYGQVWYPRAVPAGWAPYRNGHWAYVRPWGWTWIDDAPWGFAPFHYGRWAQCNSRWCWVPPARKERPIYAPAVVGFVGGIAAGAVIGAGPKVGWFPLGPREVYVPPYTKNRTYIRNINVTNVTNVTEIDRRVDYVDRRGRDDWRDERRDGERRDGGRRDGERWTYANQRYATVVPQAAFTGSQQVSRSALQVKADQIARAQVAPVAAPPAPQPPDERRPAVKGPDGKGPAGKGPDAREKPGTPPVAAKPGSRTEMGGMPTLGRPDRPQRPPAPGPRFTQAPARPDAPPAPGQPPVAPPKPGAPDGKTAPPSRPDLPPLRGRDAAPPATPKPGAPVAPPPSKAPERVVPPPAGQPPVRERDAAPPTPPKPGVPAAPPPAAKPPERVVPPGAAQPPVRDRDAAPRGTPPKAAPKPPDHVTPPKAAPKPPERAAPPPRPEPSRAAPPVHTAPPPVHRAPPPPPKAAPPVHTAPPPRPAPPPVHTAPPPPPKAAPPAPPPKPAPSHEGRG
jgi:hypothetical protein